jgi:hypothetical protein
VDLSSIPSLGYSIFWGSTLTLHAVSPSHYMRPSIALVYLGTLSICSLACAGVGLSFPNMYCIVSPSIPEYTQVYPGIPRWS